MCCVEIKEGETGVMQFKRIQAARSAEGAWNSARGCAVIAVVGFALSFAFLWSVGENIGVTAENAVQAVFQVASAEVGELGYDGPAWTAVSTEGGRYVLRSRDCRGRFEEIIDQVHIGDVLTVKINRAGSILEMEREGLSLLSFEEAAGSVQVETVVFGLISVFMAACGVAALLRSVQLARRRRMTRKAANIP